MVKILLKDSPDPVNRIREKLDRWNEYNGRFPGWGLPGPIAHTARRVCRHLQRLPKLVPPRVCAAVFRTVFNGWTTHRRFQQRHLKTNICLLGCQGQAEDSIEHYCRCPALQYVLRTRLKVQLRDQRALTFWVLDEPGLDKDEYLICSALINYGGYMATNMFRHSAPAASNQVAIQAINQLVRSL